MAQDYQEQRATRTRKAAETRDRRTAPEHSGPPSVREIEKLYKKDQIASNLNTDGGDGLQSKSHHDFEVKAQAPQPLGDEATNGRLPDYHNDVPEGSWLRGHGKQGAGHLNFDSLGRRGSGHRYPSCKPEKGAPCTATGQDQTKSPFSAAYRKGAGEGF
jgi:hypothetical protein